ncbi:MAG TPA: VOC family protein [Phycisphaerae bacterium]|nr:VOC family protein [Phycisphaerae bacterium]
MPPLSRIHETCLYAIDLAAMERFYTAVLGLRKVSEMSPRGLTFRVNAQSVLLVFNPALTKEPQPQVPTHGATGPGHCAFSIDPLDVDAWRQHLAAYHVPIERETTWENGAISLYFRDPANNSIELIAGQLWPP